MDGQKYLLVEHSKMTGKQFLGRHVVASKTAVSSARNNNQQFQGHQTSPNLSFGVEFDDDALFAVDQLEKDYIVGKDNVKPNLTKSSSVSTTTISAKRFTQLKPEVPPVGASNIKGRNDQNSPANGYEIELNEKVKIADCVKSDAVDMVIGKVEFLTPSSKIPGRKMHRKATSREATDDAACTWNTPLHVSTPVEIRHKAEEKKLMKPSTAQDSETLATVESSTRTPRTLGSKPRLEKTKLFEAILNKSEIADHVEEHCDLADRNNSHLDNSEKARSPNNSATTSQHASCNIGKPSQASSLRIVDPTERLALSSWGLPAIVLQRYAERGITSMFEWQAECLCTGNVLAGGNLVYAAPTSAGKTMVAELLILKCILETKKKALFILPFVAVAREKVLYLQGLFQDAGVRVDGYFGNSNPAGGFGSVDIAICTIEKANNLVNRLLEDNKIDQLGVVVVDELHLVGDAHRGYLLELLLTKLRYFVRKSSIGKTASDGLVLAPHSNPLQIIGMSATLPNLDMIAGWIDAELYRTDYRPVPLTEMVKIGNEIYDSTLSVRLRSITSGTNKSGDDGDIIPLCLETIYAGCSVLIFCPTKPWCEKLADSIAREFYRLSRQVQPPTTGFAKGSELVPLTLNFDALRDVVEQLRRTPVGLDALLAKMVPCGVAFHHAGLTFDERDIVEGAFRNGALRVLVATSTLSSGVNLPARRVIVRTPMFHGAVIDTLTYKQMVGRAGRKGVDSSGESILVCKPNERTAAVTLANSELPPVSSCLFHGNSAESLSSSMKRAILEIIVSKVASTPQEVEMYAQCTLLAASLASESAAAVPGAPAVDKLNAVKLCVNYLEENEFILRRTSTNSGIETETFAPTQLGSAIVASGLSPDEGLVVFAELQKARRCFVLENELHTVYLVTPIYIQDQWSNIDWMQYLCLWEQLPVDMKRVAELVGVQERFLARAVRSGGNAQGQNAAQLRTAAIHRRFYASMALHDLANEMPLPAVVKKYGCTRGVLQSLQQSAATFAGMVTVFCARLGWYNLELLLTQFQSRLSFGVQRELVDLVRVSLLNAQRARAIFSAGYQTVAALASAEPAALELVLRNSAPFLSKKKAEDEDEWELAERSKSRCIWVTGQKGLTEYEAAVLVVQEAKKLVADDLLQMGIEWKPQKAAPQPLQKANDDKETSVSASRRRSVAKHSKSTPKSNHLQRSRSSNKKPKDCSSTENNSLAVHNLTVLTPPVVLTPRASIDNSPARDDEGKGGKIDNGLAGRSDELASHLTLEKDFRNAGMLQASATEHCRASVGNGLITESCVGGNRPLGEHRISGNVPLGNHCGSGDTPLIEHHVGGGTGNAPVGERCGSGDTCLVQSIGFIPVDMKPVDELASENKEIVTAAAATAAAAEDAEDAEADVNISDTSLFLDTQAMNAIMAGPAAHQLPDKNTDPIAIANLSLDAEHLRAADDAKAFPEVPTGVESVPDVFQSEGFSPQFGLASATCQFMKNFSTQQLARDGVPSRVDVENLKSTNDEKIVPAVSVNKPAANDSLLFSSELLPASNYEHVIVPSFFAADCSRNAGYSEDLLFEDDNVSNHNNTVDLYKAKAEGLLVSVMCERNVSYDASVDVAMNNSDLFASFVEDYPNEAAVRVTDAAAKVNAKPQVQSAIDADHNQAVDSFALGADDSITCTMFERALAQADILPALKVAQSALAESISTKPSDAGDALQENKNRIHTTDELPQRNFFGGDDASPNASRKSSINAINALCDKFLEANGHEKKAPKRNRYNHNADGLKRDSVSRTSESKRRRTLSDSSPLPSKENDLNAAICSQQNISFGSASDSSVCVPPTPPLLTAAGDRSGVAGAAVTPRRLLIGVSGNTTPLKTPASILAKAPFRSDSAAEVNKANTRSSNEVEHEDVKNDLPAVLLVDSSSQPSSTCGSFTIIDVAANRHLFDTFIDEWHSKRTFSLSLACEKRIIPAQQVAGKSSSGIGAKFTRGGKKPLPVAPVVDPEVDGLPVDGTELVLIGLAVSWEAHDAYFISLTNTNPSSSDLDGSMMAPPLDRTLSVTERLTAVRSVLDHRTPQHDVAALPRATLTMFDAKEQYKILCRCCGITMQSCVADPKVACWLLDPASHEKNLQSMVTNYGPQDVYLLQGITCGTGLGSLGLNPIPTVSGRLRSCLEAVLIGGVLTCLQHQLEEADLYRSFVDIEMPSLIILAKMELNGFGFNQSESDSQKGVIQAKLSALEELAYQLAGHPFSLTSVDDVGQVLYGELHLPPSGEVDTAGGKPGRTLGARRGATNATRRTKQSWSTAKDVLEKLRPLHPLPGVLLEWRRLTSTLTKVIFPLQRERTRSDRLAMDRIHGVVDTFTTTGRVTMHEPNLQNIPKDFIIEIPNVLNGSNVSFGSSSSRRSTRSRTSLLSPRYDTSTVSFSVSMRQSFIPFTGGVLIAADYSQLELRVIAHLSGDRKLIDVLNGGGDVFKLIASQWKMIDIESVTTEQRQHAKQVCYGMIYGIGAQALGEQFGVGENDGAVFIETFKSKFTGLRSFLRETVQACRRNGYVTTITGRRRYLPAISDANVHAKAHAERQAVNTTVQGSGADLVKVAMINIDRELAHRYPSTLRTHRHRQDSATNGSIRHSTRASMHRADHVTVAPPSGAYFVLQLHDELIYEVNSNDLREVALIVKRNMESAMPLSVKLPVKLKAGSTWGNMAEMDV